MRLLALASMLACSFQMVASAQNPLPGGDDLGAAIRTMRNVKTDGLSYEQYEAKAKELDHAWKTLRGAGALGVAALKGELKKIDASGEKDDGFKLGAAAVLWQIGGVNEADTIASIWSTADLSANFNYVLLTAVQAAGTLDARVEPMLIAVLRDQKAGAYAAAHSMPIPWPYSHLFIWGRYGSKGRPALARLLNESKDETTLASAIYLLANYQHLDSLPRIRSLAHEGTGIVRREAIKALGEFGDPRDFDFLVDGLKGPAADAVASAYALYEFEDLRAVPFLVPLLSSGNADLAKEVAGGLMALPTVQGLDALLACSTDKAHKQQSVCSEALEMALREANLTPKDYATKNAAERANIVVAIQKERMGAWDMKPGDRKLTNDDLVNAAARWIASNRITDDWVKDRHLVAAATPSDIMLFIDVAASCCARVSDEATYEIFKMYRVVRWLGRSRYRATPGLCEKAEPKR